MAKRIKNPGGLDEMTVTIKQAAHIAKSSNADYWMQQVNRDMPYGDCDAMVNAARQERLIVTQCDGKRFLVNHTAWVSIYGCVSPAN